MLRPGEQHGGVLVLVALSLTVLLGIAALAIDSSNMRAHRAQMQSLADAAALAGAAQLPPFGDGSKVCSQADVWARQSTTLVDPKDLVDNSHLDTSDCRWNASQHWVQVHPVESNVPYAFGRVFGFVNATIDARAQARVVYLTQAKGLLPIGVEDLEPRTVQIVVDSTGQKIPLGGSGCMSPTAEGFPFWCGAAYVTGLPAGGSTVSLQVTDSSGEQITWSGIGFIGSDQPVPGCTGCTVKDVVVNPVTDPFISYTSTSTPKQFGVLAHLTGLASNAKVKLTVGGTTVTVNNPTSGTAADGTWATSNTAFTSSGTQGASSVQISVVTPSGTCKKGCDVPRAQQVYARDDGELLQQYSQSRTYVDPTLGATAAGRWVSFNTAFTVLVPGRVITLKFAGGGALGAGNYGTLDLDANRNLRDEITTGAYTPYALGDPVWTDTGNSSGQVDQGLAARINGSPNHYTGDPSSIPPGDPRWTSLLLVPPLGFQNANGRTQLTVIGFGNFYITEYSGDPGSKLKNGAVRGFFWNKVNPTGPYQTTCQDASGNPSDICLAGIALMPWTG